MMTLWPDGLHHVHESASQHSLLMERPEQNNIVDEYYIMVFIINTSISQYAHEMGKGVKIHMNNACQITD